MFESFAVGRLSRMTDGSGETRYCHDRFGNLTRKVQVTNGQAFTVRYAYTKVGKLSAIQYPDGMQVDYVRDGLGRAIEVGVTRNGGVRQVLLTGATYHSFGPIAGWTFGNGRTMSRTLDLDYRPKTILSTGIGAGGLNLGYGWDAVGNLSSLHTSGLEQPPRITFGYDALNRLTAFKDGRTGTTIEGYAYDATGNRTSSTNADGTLAYDYPATSHRLNAVNGVPRSYDAIGNTISIGGTEREFGYNSAGRMSRVERNNTLVMEYSYNGRGEQVCRSLGETRTHALYDEAGHWLGDADAAQSPHQQVVWLDDMPVGVIANGDLLYIEPDHLSTPRAVIEPQRDVAVWTWDIASEAFGASVPTEDPDDDAIAFVLDLRFPGQRHDAASGLSQNYFRDYEPGSGRYVQSDPIGLRGGIATYEYARSAALMWKDARGLSPISCANIQSRVGPGTIGTIQCDGKGGFEIVNCASSCMRKCTAAHESQHIVDYKNRYGANGCANRARGDLPDDESAAPFDLTPYDRFRAMSECRAYAAGKRCAEGLLKKGCGCESEANAEISAADAQRRAYSCSAYGL